MNSSFILQLDFASRMIIALLLVVAAFTKLKDSKLTAETIQDFGIVPKKIAYRLGIFLSLTEIVTGLGIVISGTIVFASAISATLFLAFTFALIYAIKTGKSIVCGCFGNSRRERINRLTIYRSGLLFIASFTIYVLHTDYLYQLNHARLLLSFSSAVSSSIGLLLSFGMSSLDRDGREEEKFKVSRRDFLKLLGAVTLALITLPVKPAFAICCKCQEYRHYDPACCTGNLYHVRHYFKRCCNPCTGQIGGWNHYQPNGCQCNCENHVSLCGDKIFACTGNPCWPGQCGCAV